MVDSKVVNKIGQPEQPDMSRRNLLKSVGLVGAAAVSAGTAGAVIAADSSNQQAATATSAAQSIPAREALEVLTAAEVETLEAICDCLIPSDANGPGAREARAVHYIDRSLASHNRADRQNYMIGLNAINEFALQTRRRAFHALNKDQQNSILRAVQENTLTGFMPSGAAFFNMVRNHTIDGTFCDPYYGGNRDFIGWDLLRYPGVRLGVTEADVAQGASLPPNHQSAYDHAAYLKSADYMGNDDHA
ncbi:MAG: hypothetical protein EXR84_11300 [Gammaproteobacteria bacterium]|nr:hypothetical protein [Gammaproteobacteria bacterium]